LAQNGQLQVIYPSKIKAINQLQSRHTVVCRVAQESDLYYHQGVVTTNASVEPFATGIKDFD